MAIPKEKIHYLDLFRCFAIMAVVAIHMTSMPVTTLPHTSWMFRLAYIINTGSQFAVPSFLFLSALLLTYNYEARWNRSAMWLFYQKRLKFIFIPYFFWSFFYFVILGLTGHLSFGSSAAWKGFFINLLTGSNFFHLYFIVIIIQFYILFPLLIKGLKEWPLFRNHLVLSGICLQILFFACDRWVYPIPYKSTILFNYALFLILGADAGLRFPAYMDKLKQRGILVTFGAVLFAFLYLSYIWIHMEKLFSFGVFKPYAINFLYYTYISLCCLTLLYLSQQLYRPNRIVFLLSTIGITSFGIYFVHPVLLDLWHYLFMTSNPMKYPFMVAGSGLFALIIPWAVFYYIKRYRWSWIVSGK